MDTDPQRWEQLLLFPETSTTGFRTNADGSSSRPSARSQDDTSPSAPVAEFVFALRSSGVIVTKRFTLDLSLHNSALNGLICAAYADALISDGEVLAG